MDDVFRKAEKEHAKRELQRIEQQRISELSEAERAQLDKSVAQVIERAGRGDENFPSAFLADIIMDASIGISVLHDELPSHVLLRMAAALRQAEAEGAIEIVLDRFRRLMENGGSDD